MVIDDIRCMERKHIYVININKFEEKLNFVGVYLGDKFHIFKCDVKYFLP
jgi:hypothetical protein